MANRNFSTWLSGFRDSIADYGYYIDFEKVHHNVDSIKVELNILNSLIGLRTILSIILLTMRLVWKPDLIPMVARIVAVI